MFKQLVTIFLLILLVPIAIAANITTCPTCPQPTPYIVYVTVTIPVPVQPTPQPTQIVSAIGYPTPSPTPSIITQITTQFTTNTEYLIYVGLFALLIIGIIMMRRKQKRKPKLSKPEPVQDKYGDLYEEEEEDIKPIIKKEQKNIKKPKKPKSLLDQDFEF